MAQTNPKLKAIKDALKSKGVAVEDLAVLMIPGDQIIGELVGESGPVCPVNRSVKVKNPKRILREMMRTNEGVVINFMVGDLDMVEEGMVFFHPHGGYRVDQISEDSQVHLLAIYADFMERKMMNKAKEAGLILPNQGVIKGK